MTIFDQVVEYFADILLANYNTDPEVKAFVDAYDFYIYPVVNPDGMSEFIIFSSALPHTISL